MKKLLLLTVLLLSAQMVNAQVSLPVTFESDTTDYEITDFGGNASEMVADPEDEENTVVKSTKTADAELWAGTTVADASGFVNALPFEEGQTVMTVKVWSPQSGIPVRLKVEKVSNGDISVETEDTTTVAEGWETLTFDFTNEMPDTPALDFEATYNKASMFFNFGTTGADAGEQTYYWDDLTFGTESGGGSETESLAFPLNFEGDITWSGHLTDFDGGQSEVIENPDKSGINESDSVLKLVKGAGQNWAGSYIQMPEAIEISDDFSMTVNVWAPRANTTMLLKLENKDDSETFVELEKEIAESESWTEVTFDLSNADPQTGYHKVVMIFDMGTEGDGSADYTWYVDDITTSSTTDIADRSSEVPEEVKLDQNYPNPFNPSTTIDFTLPASNSTTIAVYDVTGQRVATLVDKNMSAGHHSVKFNAAGLSSGIYFYRIQSGNVQITKQMTLLK